MPTIDKLSSADALAPNDLLPVHQYANGDTRKVTVGTLAAHMHELVQGAPDNTIYELAMAGASFVANALPAVAGGSVWAQLALSGPAPSGTINLPPIDSRANGQEVLVTCTQAVTVLAVNGFDASVAGAPASLAANGYFRLRYDSIANCWFRIG